MLILYLSHKTGVKIGVSISLVRSTSDVATKGYFFGRNQLNLFEIKQIFNLNPKVISNYFQLRNSNIRRSSFQ